LGEGAATPAKDWTTASLGEIHAPSLRDYGRMLWRRRWIVLLVALLAPATAVALSLRQDPVYEASSQVLLQNENLAGTLTGVPSTALANDPARLVQTQADLARVPLVARRTLAAAGVHDITADELLGNSSVSAKTDSDMLEFSVRGGDPLVIRKLAAAYAREYTGYRREVDTAAISLALTEAERRLAELRSNGDSNSPLYASVADKIQTLQTMEALQTSNAFVVRTPDSAVKVSPKPVRNGVLALALGLVLGVGLALLRETLDTRVRTADEVSQALGIPLLARLPRPSKRLAARHLLASLTQPSGASAESFRLLRTNLSFASLEHPARSILVTSALKGEGKTTTAANLAVTFARAGRRVALVDLDLRRPTLHKFFGLRSSPGLTDVVLGHSPLSDAMNAVLLDSGRPSGGPHEDTNGHRTRGLLEVLPAGQIPSDPAEFIETSSLGRLLDELHQHYDLVLIDSPPVLAVGDPLMLSARVDGVLLVARLALLRRPMLEELRRQLEMSPARLLGFVLASPEAEERSTGTPSYGYYRSPYPTMAPHEPAREPTREGDRLA
jgi:Mrp family chromosome partitioning ATPase/capsular polysaccharide biosynthesis protein